MLYRLLLRCFPARFRARHGTAMAAQFDAQRAAVRGRPLAIARLWLGACGDAMRHGAAERLAASRRAQGGTYDAPMFSGWLRDARLAIRLLWRQPGFSTVACLTLALGIGANTAVFSVVDAALLKPLPYPAPKQLVSIFISLPDPRGEYVFVVTGGASAPRLRAIPGVFQEVGSYTGARPLALAHGYAKPLQIGGLTAGALEVLGVRPQFGRALTVEDVDAGAVVISDEHWRRQFGRSPDAIGARIRLARGPVTIVGVMPASFRFLVGPDADAWELIAERDAADTIARLREGLTIADAQQVVDAYLANPDSPWRPHALRVEPASIYRDTARAGTMLYVLLGAVSCLLLIACANVANMLLARGVSRRREIAVRSALGASRGRLVRLFFAEGLVLAVAGGLAAVGVAGVGLSLLPRLVPAELVSTILGVTPPSLDTRVLSAGLGATLLSAVLCAALPAIRATRRTASLGAAVSTQRGGGESREQRRMSAVFQTLQVALTVVLLTGAGLLVSAFVRTATAPIELDPDGLAQLSFEFPADLPTGSRRAVMDDLVARIATLPDVGQARMGESPFGNGIGGRFIVGDDPAPAVRVESFFTPLDYFEMTGMRLVAGRQFTQDDLATPDEVALIDERTARRFWPDRPAVGQRFRTSPGAALTTVVGVLARTPTIYMRSDTALVYRPFTDRMAVPSVLFRIQGDRERALAAVSAAVSSAWPGMHPRRLGLVTDLFAEFDPLGPSRFYSLLMTLFAGLGLLTAMVGLYGQLSHSVNRRMRDIGVRMALGAGPGRVGRSVLVEALLPVVVGLGLGLMASTWLGAILAAQLHTVHRRDPAALVAVPVILLAVTALAGLVPVRRALSVDPAVALRAE